MEQIKILLAQIKAYRWLESTMNSGVYEGRAKATWSILQPIWSKYKPLVKYSCEVKEFVPKNGNNEITVIMKEVA